MICTAGCISVSVIYPAGQVIPMVSPGFRYGGIRQGTWILDFLFISGVIRLEG